jgi:tetratricopeptide (TPR) repeat protein
LNEVPGGGKAMGADGAASAASNPETVILESDVPLSRSVIWSMQREFYAERGLRAWTEDKVPEYITNNPFIAEIYARIVSQYICECLEISRKEPRPVSPQNPLRILELGAGPGRFSYLFLRHLSVELQAKGIALENVRYCMTDCAESLLEAWRGNRKLAEFVARGMLEFELLAAGEEVKSRFGGRQESAGSVPAQGPLVVIANYVFDSLPQDAFVIKEGKIFEALATTTTTGPGSEGRGREEISQLQISYKDVPVPPKRYAEQTWNDLLELYRSRLAAATVLFPVEALKTLQGLNNFTDGRMLVLAADKGYAHEEELALCQGPPTLEFHAPNCFSQIVNFDAIGKYFRASGGDALLPDKHFASLNICAFLRGRQGDQFPATKSAYRGAQAEFGPEDLFTLFAWLNAHMEEMTVQQILAALRLSRWDPVALLWLYPVLARQLRGITRERLDLRDAVLRTWANHYPVQPGENALAFQCGVILLELRFFAEAQPMFKVSEREFGRSAATSYNLGLCSQGLGRTAEALAFMAEACELDPAFEPARLARGKLERENARD